MRCLFCYEVEHKDSGGWTKGNAFATVTSLNEAQINGVVAEFLAVCKKDYPTTQFGNLLLTSVTKLDSVIIPA